MASLRLITDSIARRLALIGAALAMLVLVLAPPGFMVAPGPQGPALVVCTGHGPLMMAGQADSAASDHHKAPKSRSNAPCVFAGHVAAPTPDLPSPAAPQALVLAASEVKVLVDQAPGRGLVAPPPPSQGPPILA